MVRCHGRLVAGVGDELYQAVKPLMPEMKEVVIDLADLTYVDSMGLGMLVRLYLAARQAGCRMRLEHLGKQVRNVLKMTNLLSVFGDAEGHNITVA